jgi:hypothetical protein
VRVGHDKRAIYANGAASLGVIFDIAVAKYVATGVGIVPAPDVEHEVIRTYLQWVVPPGFFPNIT